jgi:hypothetical protein
MKTIRTLVLGAFVATGAMLTACSPASPAGSVSLPAVSLPPVSIDPSAAAAAITTVLNELDSAIASNQTQPG